MSDFRERIAGRWRDRYNGFITLFASSFPSAWSSDLLRNIGIATLFTIVAYATAHWIPDAYMANASGWLGSSTSTQLSPLVFMLVGVLTCLVSWPRSQGIPQPSDRSRALIPLWVLLPNLVLAFGIRQLSVAEEKLVRSCAMGGATAVEPLLGTYSSMSCEERVAAGEWVARSSRDYDLSLKPVPGAVAFAYSVQRSLAGVVDLAVLDLTCRSGRTSRQRSSLVTAARMLHMEEDDAAKLLASEALPLATFHQALAPDLKHWAACQNQAPTSQAYWYAWAFLCSLGILTSGARTIVTSSFFAVGHLLTRALLPSMLALMLAALFFTADYWMYIALGVGALCGLARLYYDYGFRAIWSALVSCILIATLLGLAFVAPYCIWNVQAMHGIYSPVAVVSVEALVWTVLSGLVLPSIESWLAPLILDWPSWELKSLFLRSSDYLAGKNPRTSMRPR